MNPLISVIVICHDMRREAPRTLYSLSRRYQRGIENLDYEVIVVDNGSSQPLLAREVEAFGPEFRYRFFPTQSQSPVAAINAAVAESRGLYVAICIDGARILSPGMLRFMALGTRLSQRPVINSLAWHLGSKIQKVAMLEGYDQSVEDELLAGSDWQADGYRLFGISCLANSSGHGWFRPVSESNCIVVSRAMYDELKGFDTGFATPGGGYANLDFFKRACELDSSDLITLLGEGTFHQFHGGAATNARPEVHPGKRFVEEYVRMRGHSYTAPTRPSIFLGTVPEATWSFVDFSAKKLASP